jgi:hypothetical protein
MVYRTGRPVTSRVAPFTFGTGMHPDVHLVRTRPPILDVPPLVWIDPPGAPKVRAPSTPLWEWPPPRGKRLRHKCHKRLRAQARKQLAPGAAGRLCVRYHAESCCRR